MKVCRRFVSERWIGLLAVLCVTGVCFLMAGADAVEGRLASARIAGVPHHVQKPDFCGEACISMWLEKLGKQGDQDWVFDQSGLDPMKGRGVYTAELAAAARTIGFKTGAVWYRVDASSTTNSRAGMDLLFRAMVEDLVTSVPSIVCMRWNDEPRSAEHFRLVLGYDAVSDEVLFHDPAGKDGADKRMKRDEFIRLWPLKYEPNAWTVIRLRLEGAPEALKDSTVAGSPTAADFAQRVMQLKPLLPAGFSIAISPPFVVVGNDSDITVNRWANGTVKWAADQFKSLYFTRELDHVITVWLFRDDATYRKYAREILGDQPDTPFGYYSGRHQALVMNIATGGGTLVHEIVHPYMRVNFAECPDWFNEGMGSLYEQSAERDGKIVGLTNWRLAGLQNAIRAGQLPTFETLTGNGDFYRKDPGTNYAQARYLCFYLQEKGLLPGYYRKFVENQKTDPTGYRTLQSILGERDMAAFQKKWETWVLGLTFP